MDVGDSVGHSATADQRQQQTAAVGLQPLFDSSVSLPQDGPKYDMLSASTSPTSGQALGQTMYSPPQADAQTGNGSASIFGRLPTSVGSDSTLAPRLQSSVAAASAAHSRTASYGTSLLDTLNEEKQFSNHQRHFTLSSAFSLMGQGDGQQTAVSPPGLSSTGSAGRERAAAHVRAHTLNASPPGLQKPQGAATNASGMLGAHGRLGSLSGLGTTSPPAAAGLSAGLGAGGLLASSALRSSYSSNSLRSMFAHRSSPQPTNAEGAGIGGATNAEFSQALDEGVWGPSGLSNELDILATPDARQTGLSDRLGRHLSLDDASNRQRTLDDAMKRQLNLDDAASRQLSLHDAMNQAHRRSGSLAGNETMARMRSYSFAGAPDGAESGDEADIDVLHAAATAQNPALAFRRMVARTHARSKTLASPFANGAPAQRRTTHARQASDGGAGTVHVGIGGESVAGATSVQHSRQPSQVVAHSRQHSVDADFGAAGDGVPTRSLWVGNVDPGLSSQDLVAQFGKYGRVESLRLLPDKECAFVNFLRVEDAVRAHEAMHAGARIGGNTVRVGFGKGEAHATGDAQAMQPTRALWIGNIAAAAAADQLGSVFGRFGEIESARVLNHKNCGFVNFVRLEDAVRAKQAMNGKSIDGAVVRIGYAKVPPAKTDAVLKLRNPVPAAAPLTASGARAEAAASRGTTQCGLGSRGALEPGVSLAVNEDLVAFPYATHVPHVPPPTVAIRADGDTAPGRLPLLSQARLRELRRQLDGGTIPRDAFARITAELLPHVVDLCTDYVGNVLVQRMAERGDAALRLSLVRRVAPHMAAIGIHKNGTWAVQKLIDCADTPAQRRMIVRALRQYTPQLLLDQLGNYVVQGCLGFGAPVGSASDTGDGVADLIADPFDTADPATGSSGDSTASAAAASADSAAGASKLSDVDSADQAAASPKDPTDADASNQFVFDAIHARCLDVAQGRFGARAVRTCLESSHASRMQQKLVAVSLVTNAAALATNANGHLLINWLLDSSSFAGRFRVLAHQLAPHLRYLATHKLGASTVTKLVDQSHEPDARDLILNTLFYNPDPSVLEDVLADQSQGVHVVLRVLQGSAIGDAEKARLADRLRPVLSSPNIRASAALTSPGDAGSSVSPVPSSNSATRMSPGVSASQRLADVVAGILAYSQPVYPPSGSRASIGAASASPPVVASQQQTMPSAQHYQAANAQQQQQLGFHMMPPHMSAGAVAMSFPVGGSHPQAAHLPPAGFGGMAGPGQFPPFGTRTLSADLLAASTAAPFYHPQQLQQMQSHDAAASMFAPMDYSTPAHSAMPVYPFATEMYPPVSSATPPQPQSQPPSAKPDTTPPVEAKE
ncbi:hypothetical protein H4R24_003388 [Coemansia sp. RSA 988]|nr:hypothetical protein H4R24_003388 [Coemansia sp. RSA 988]